MEIMPLINLVIKQKDLPLTIIGLRLPMRQIRPMRGMSISTLAMTIGMVRRMRVMFGVLEVDSDLTFGFSLYK
jgi:hypothetical protein